MSAKWTESLTYELKQRHETITQDLLAEILRKVAAANYNRGLRAAEQVLDDAMLGTAAVVVSNLEREKER